MERRHLLFRRIEATMHSGKRHPDSVLDVPQPTASRHLAYLKRSGLIVARKNSYWTFYAMAPAPTPLRRKLLDCLDADRSGQARDAKRLASIRRNGGCCPM